MCEKQRSSQSSDGKTPRLLLLNRVLLLMYLLFQTRGQAQNMMKHVSTPFPHSGSRFLHAPSQNKEATLLQQFPQSKPDRCVPRCFFLPYAVAYLKELIFN